MDKPIPEDVRHQFETWARPKWRHREDFDQRIGAPRGTYNNIEVQAAWEAWQALTAAQQQGQAVACDMGELCIGCEPRNPDGSCPDKQPGAVDEKYAELIYAVARKYPGESRHETALRYIRQAESADHGPAQVAAQHQEPKS